MQPFPCTAAEEAEPVASERFADLLRRSGDLKGELVTFAQSRRWSKHLQKTLRRQFGETVVADEEKLSNVIDHFLLQHRLPDGRAVVEHFVASRPDLPAREQDMLLGWRDVVEGIFEIGRRDGEAVVAVNLIDEMTYRIHSNMGPSVLTQFPRGDFLIARLVPIEDAWLLSGAQVVLPKAAKREILRIAAGQAIQHPELVFRNPARLARGWELQRWERERFIEFFGSDLVVVPGPRLSARMLGFWRWRTRLTPDGSPAGGRTRRKPAQVPLHDLVDLPADLTEADDVAVVYDDEEGLTYLAEFGLVEAAFADPELAADRRHRQAVLGYLKDDSVSTLPFRRLAERNTENASRLFQRLLNKPKFSWPRDGDILLRKHKPGCFERERRPSITPLSDTLARHVQAPRQTAHV